MKDNFFIALQRLTPQHLLSRLAGTLANSENPLIKNTFIRWFVKRYQVDMSLALEENPTAYPNFNAFFTRALKPTARPLDPAADSIVCPADGVISQLGQIVDGRVLQAKGQDFSVLELLGGQTERAEQYRYGQFMTIYLSPRDYHRVHMPLAGKLEQMTHIPGQLFSVNKVTAEHVPRLFARNERVACHFQTENGPLASVMVGAMIVASIETAWAGLVAPARRQIRHTDYLKHPTVELAKGDEMGRFLLGSTVILLLPQGASTWSPELIPGSQVQMGQKIGGIV